MSDENTFISTQGAWATFIKVMHLWREGEYSVPRAVFNTISS